MEEGAFDKALEEQYNKIYEEISRDGDLNEAMVEGWAKVVTFNHKIIRKLNKL
jgi:hypothetical protein